MPDTSVFPCIPLVHFKLPPWCRSSEQIVWVSESMCGFPKRNCLGFQQPPPPTIPAGFHSRKLWGLISLALESWTGVPSVGLGLLAPEISLPNFYPCGCQASPYCACVPPTSLDGCGSFNSIVVRLPFNSISGVPEWWLFYVLVVILMWLCEEVSHVCLHRYLLYSKTFLRRKTFFSL